MALLFTWWLKQHSLSDEDEELSDCPVESSGEAAKAAAPGEPLGGEKLSDALAPSSIPPPTANFSSVTTTYTGIKIFQIYTDQLQD